VSTADGLAPALRAQLHNAIGDLDVNRVGVAARTSANDTAVLILLSRRLVDLEPVPARVRRGGSARLSGHLCGNESIKSASLALDLPGDVMQSRPLNLAGRAFTELVSVGDTPGVARLEILVDYGRGPEIAAILPVGVDLDPGTNAAPASTTDADVDIQTEGEMESALAALILGSRIAAGTPIIATSAGLADAARAHATEMRDIGFFAHVSPTTGDVTRRLATRGVHYVRALEDIAIGESVDAVWQQWMESPAHRANLLDSMVTALGVGVVSKQTAGGIKVYAVAVLAKLADDGDGAELAHDAVTQVNNERHRRGLAPLYADPALSRLALRHSQELARLGRVDDATPAGGALVDTVFEELEVSAAAADVFLANSMAAVVKSTHLRESFRRVGVGVFRDVRRAGPQLYVTVIYASE
jgi:uncharacterized protein YkwD